VEDLTEELEARDVRLTGSLVLDHEHEEDYDIEPSELVYMCMHCLLDMRPSSVAPSTWRRSTARRIA
jgi:hypothetical protein